MMNTTKGMMKIARNYLNRQENEMFGITLVMHEAIREYIKRNDKNMGKDEKKYLKMTISFYQKFLEGLFDRVGPDAGHRMMKDFKNKTITYTDKGSTKELIHLDPEAFFDLAEGVINGHCFHCRDRKKDCVIRELMINSQVPPYDESGECPYYQR